jgi:hypothetical protein
MHADQTSEAAAVDPHIARHSGRSFLPLQAVINAEELAALTAAATTHTSSEALDAAHAALDIIASAAFEREEAQ